MRQAAKQDWSSAAKEDWSSVAVAAGVNKRCPKTEAIKMTAKSHPPDDLGTHVPENLLSHPRCANTCRMYRHARLLECHGAKHWGKGARCVQLGSAEETCKFEARPLSKST